jgi:glycosyltransferase involved in cell wall biosynthesis
MPLFSVIIPTFNRESLLIKTINSVFGQSFTDFEVIIVDDGSTDGTADYAKSIGERARLIRQISRGPGVARNLGAKYANGLYLAFLDSDDLWFPWTLEVYRQVIENGGSSPAFVAGKPVVFVSDDEIERIHVGEIKVKKFSDYLASGDEWRWWGASSFVVRRDVFLNAGGFSDNRINGEDADLALRLGVAPGFIQIAAPVCFAYRLHADAVTYDANRTLAGAWHSVRCEKVGKYPGGVERARERWLILTRHLRPIILAAIQQGRFRDAWCLYIATFRWNAALRRVRYLSAFPFIALLEGLRHIGGAKST